MTIRFDVVLLAIVLLGGLFLMRDSIAAHHVAHPHEASLRGLR